MIAFDFLEPVDTLNCVHLCDDQKQCLTSVSKINCRHHLFNIKQWIHMSIHLIIIIITIITSHGTNGAPASETFTHFNPEHNPNPPIHCKSNSMNGICMFAFECMHSRGNAIGLCVQGRFVGTCCTFRKRSSMQFQSDDQSINHSGHNSPPVLVTGNRKLARIENSDLNVSINSSYELIPETIDQVTTLSMTNQYVPVPNKSVHIELIHLSNATPDTSSNDLISSINICNDTINLSPNLSDIKYQVISTVPNDQLLTSTLASVSEMLLNFNQTTVTLNPSAQADTMETSVNSNTMFSVNSTTLVPATVQESSVLPVDPSINEVTTTQVSIDMYNSTATSPSTLVLEWHSTLPAITTIKPVPIVSIQQNVLKNNITTGLEEVTTSKPPELDTQTTINNFKQTTTTSVIVSTLPNILSEINEKMYTPTPKPVSTTSSLFRLKKDCGHRPLRSRARVVGGRNAQFGEWPWQVLVKEATWLGLFVKTKCGGVLIDTKWVLTAAHCQPVFLGSLVVIVGEYDLSGDGENLKPVARSVKRMIIHRDYNAHTFENDIALLELETPLGIQPHVLPICLPDPEEQFVGKMAFVAGWGKLNYGGSVPSILQVARLPVLDNTVCQQMFFSAGHIKKIRDTFLCAGYTNGGKDSCEGDSGGPLMSQRDNGQWVLLGTVSHGIKCAEPNLPGVYMRTTAYLKWIDNVIRKSVFRPPVRSNGTSGASTINKLVNLSSILSATTSRPERMALPIRRPKFPF